MVARRNKVSPPWPALKDMGPSPKYLARIEAELQFMDEDLNESQRTLAKQYGIKKTFDAVQQCGSWDAAKRYLRNVYGSPPDRHRPGPKGG